MPLALFDVCKNHISIQELFESNSGALPQVSFTDLETSVAICPATLLLHAFLSMVLIDSYHMQVDYKLCRLDDARVPT